MFGIIVHITVLSDLVTTHLQLTAKKNANRHCFISATRLLPQRMSLDTMSSSRGDTP